MKKITKLLFLAITLLLAGCDHFTNYTLDSEEGLTNIEKKIKSLADCDLSLMTLFVYSTEYSDSPSGMSFIGTDAEKNITVSASYGFSNIGGDVISFPAKEKPKDKIDILSILPYIEECKKMIPEGYRYKHVTSMNLFSGATVEDKLKVVVEPIDKNNIVENEHITVKDYNVEITRVKRNRSHKTSEKRRCYLVEFSVGEKGLRFD